MKERPKSSPVQEKKRKEQAAEVSAPEFVGLSLLCSHESAWDILLWQYVLRGSTSRGPFSVRRRTE